MPKGIVPTSYVAERSLNATRSEFGREVVLAGTGMCHTCHVGEGNDDAGGADPGRTIDPDGALLISGISDGVR